MQQSLGRDKGKRSEVYYLLGKYFCHKILFIYSHITFVMVYYFYFLCFGSRRNECNSLLGREGGEVRSLLLSLSAMLNLFSSFTDNKMILKAITIHDKFIIILSRYIVCLNVCRAYMMHISQRDSPKHSDYRADGIWQYFFFRLFSSK